MLLLLAGGYLTVNALSPALHLPTDGPPDATARRLTTSKPVSDDNRLYIPQLNVDIAISTDSLAAASELSEYGSNPRNGGNYVLKASRFGLGMTPFDTKAHSPLYNIEQLTKGDQIYVDFDGTRYAYEVTDRSVLNGAPDLIEGSKDQKSLTLYSYSSLSPDIVQDVIEAKPVGTIAWVNGTAKLKTTEESASF